MGALQCSAAARGHTHGAGHNRPVRAHLRVATVTMDGPLRRTTTRNSPGGSKQRGRTFPARPKHLQLQPSRGSAPGLAAPARGCAACCAPAPPTAAPTKVIGIRTIVLLVITVPPACCAALAAQHGLAAARRHVRVAHHLNQVTAVGHLGQACMRAASECTAAHCCHCKSRGWQAGPSKARGRRLQRQAHTDRDAQRATPQSGEPASQCPTHGSCRRKS